MACKIFIATSIDGMITDREGGLDWLQTVPNPEGKDLGFAGFMEQIDALVMGRNTFEAVVGFGVPWPYSRPVFVWSHSLTEIPADLADRVSLVRGTPQSIVADLNAQGFEELYIDGGKTIQSFLQHDLIDTLIVTTIPVLLGGGVPLFGTLPAHRTFELVSVDVQLDQIVTATYQRMR